MSEIIISGKTIAQLNMPDFCPLCFWLKHRVKKTPYSIFPGIFMSIDAYTKKVVHTYFDTHGFAPLWLPELKEAKKYLQVLHHTKFRRKDEATGITLSGALDDLYECEDGEHIIPDFKTAKFSANQDKLFPLYAGQLNAYRWIHEGFGHKVKSLPLIYCEPVTGADDCTPKIYNEDGFSMGFTAHTILVDMDDALIPALLEKARNIIYRADPPRRAADCQDCKSLDAIIEALNV